MLTTTRKVQQKLPEKFYLRNTEKIARELLGKKLFHKKDGVLTSGIITETEAYLGAKDPACHTFGGHRSARVESMYRRGGHSYVYFIYGIHFCFNVVTRTENEPEAVLIRSLRPVDGIETMRIRRKFAKDLCSGPGKLCKAMGIDKSCDGLSLQSSELWIAEEIPYSKIKTEILTSPRIGVDYAKKAKDWPLRFFLS